MSINVSYPCQTRLREIIRERTLTGNADGPIIISKEFYDECIREFPIQTMGEAFSSYVEDNQFFHFLGVRVEVEK